MAAHPWFQPVGRRIGVLAVCLVWLAVELWHEPGGTWTLIAAGMTAYAVWDFFLAGNYKQGG